MIEIFRGDSKTIKVSVTNNGNVFDLTDFGAILTVKSKDQNKVLLSKEVNNIENPTTGVIVFELPPSITNITPGEYPCDIQISKAPEYKYTVYRGKMLIKSDITT